MLALLNVVFIRLNPMKIQKLYLLHVSFVIIKRYVARELLTVK